MSLSFVQIFLQAFLVGFSGAMAPGPLLTYNIQLTFKKGFWVGPKLILGHAILEMILIVGVLFGLGGLIQQTVTKVVLWILGGLMLAWMGYDLIWKESKKGIIPIVQVAASGETAKVTTSTSLNPVLAGIVISLSNPYWALWWVTIGLGYITQALTFGWAGVMVFFCGHILADLSWYSFVSAAVAGGRQFISERVYRWLLIVCGVFLVFLAGKFIYDALRTLGIFEKTIDLFKNYRKLV
jgi:threonine/homoserine/homoserine lactone efflux protein